MIAGVRVNTDSYHSGYLAENRMPEGGARYVVTTKSEHDSIRGYSTVNETSDHTLPNGNVLLLEYENEVHVTQFGAKSLDSFDSTAAVQSAASTVRKACKIRVGCYR
ncbi:hypothetical protein NVP1084O_174 [Vibrio phage 1.084.O._10N.261.49.F5]|nr:hypothetical protein NVP1084O_174 [Vibrio phage 1.084.O._10N.261.49.F5]